MKILITGTGGLIGSHVAKLLYSLEYDITGIYRDQVAHKVPWNSVIIDLSDANLENCFRGEHFSAIIHCAASIPVSLDHVGEVSAINQRIDQNVYDFVAARRIDTIFISSTSIYGFNNRINTEKDEVIIRDQYSEVKYNTEQRLANLDLASCISLRINAPYSYLQKNRTVLKIFIENALKDEDIVYAGTGLRKQDFTHVNDIAHAVKLSLESKQNGVFNIAAGQPISMEALAHLVKSKVSGCKSKIISSGKNDPQANYEALFSTDEAKNKLGWQPVKLLAEGIEEWINHFPQ